MRVFYKLLCLTIFSVIPIWSGAVLWSHRTSILQREFLDLSLSYIEISILTHATILLIWTFLICGALEILRRGNFRSFSELRLIANSKHLLLGALAITPSHSTPTAYQVSPTLPLSTILTPAIGFSMLLNILQKRREQIRQRQLPQRFSEHQQAQMRTIIRFCENDATKISNADLLTETDIVQLANSVEAVNVLAEMETHPIDEWKVMVRLYGYPQVENNDGQIALFRKKRALELLAWLCVNRDRQRRTAARTALWDVSISDASFSTVVSDLRRTLAEIEGSTLRGEWLPTTYSDEIPLHHSVVTDFDVICHALDGFKNDNTRVGQLVQALSLIRDVPFAGTSYSWADYDGTTTRLVVVALEAAQTLAEWAMMHHEVEVADIAIKAGLRVMPGCEEFLQLHKSLLTLVRTSHLVTSD